MATKPTKTAKPALAAVQTSADAATAPRAASKPAAKVAIVTHDEADVLGSDTEETAPKADTVKIKEILAAVVTKTGAKKKDAKEVMDATLAEIAAALAAGKALSLPPLGNLRVAKTMDKGGAPMLVLRLRMASGEGKGKAGKETLAEDGEDS